MAWTDITGPTWWYAAYDYGNALTPDSSVFSWSGAAWDLVGSSTIGFFQHVLAATPTGQSVLATGTYLRINSSDVVPIASLYFNDSTHTQQFAFQSTDSGICFPDSTPNFPFSGNYVAVSKIEIDVAGPSVFWTDILGCHEQ